MRGRALVVLVAAAALVGAFSPGAGAQVERETGNEKADTKTSRSTSTRTPKATPTPNLLEQTPRGTPVSLGVDPALEDAVRKGEDLILNREYDDALIFFDDVDATHKDSALGAVGKVMVYQAKMLENGDFAEEKSFDDAVKVARKKLAKAIEEPGQDVWDRMLLGGFHGVLGMHAMRKKKYWTAVDDGWEALNLMKWVKKKEPALADAHLGLGAYDYYRSAMTSSVSWLPFFPDKKKQGIAAMERALVDAQYVRPVVELILVYTYIDEKRYDDAITIGEDLATKYPKNTLVRVQLGRAWSRKGRYAKAIEVFREVEVLQPDNKVLGYYLGANLMYEGKELDQAEIHLRAFIANPPGTDWRGWGYERLGDLYVKRKKPEIALYYWKKASRDNPEDDTVQGKINRAKKKGVVAATKEPPAPEPVVTPPVMHGPIP